MATNKVVYCGNTIIDLTDSTLSNANQVLSGTSAYTRSGTKVDGSVVIQHYYTGASAPSSSLGVNGDVYLQTS